MDLSWKSVQEDGYPNTESLYLVKLVDNNYTHLAEAYSWEDESGQALLRWDFVMSKYRPEVSPKDRYARISDVISYLNAKENA